MSDALGIRRQAEAPPIKITKFDPKSLRVLVVDDSPSIRAIMGKILAEGGFENVTIRGDGKEAWETIEERAKSDPAPFDIIITDIEMPQMDGLHLTNRIKQSERFKDIPVVLFSSLISADNKRKGQAVGADEQITKFNAEELLAAVERCLKREAAGLEA
ncbi:MAG: Chemotaxis protein CheV [candidate division BRC1 bacterium ADurb.BinA364]|nr:MAG: Chemotaxis protein CheV [candidate division BRC1 bacterium ADurb.BinA364]